jgi:hypothetical protein
MFDGKFLQIGNEIIAVDKITRVEIQHEKVLGEEEDQRIKVIIHFENSESTLIEENAENFLKSIKEDIKLTYK